MGEIVHINNQTNNRFTVNVNVFTNSGSLNLWRPVKTHSPSINKLRTHLCIIQKLLWNNHQCITFSSSRKTMRWHRLNKTSLHFYLSLQARGERKFNKAKHGNATSVFSSSSLATVSSCLFVRQKKRPFVIFLNIRDFSSFKLTMDYRFKWSSPPSSTVRAEGEGLHSSAKLDVYCILGCIQSK